jgi:hypothetical protein
MSLGNAIILGNDLRNYCNVLPDRELKEKAPAIFKVVEGMFPLPETDWRRHFGMERSCPQIQRGI